MNDADIVMSADWTSRKGFKRTSKGSKSRISSERAERGRHASGTLRSLRKENRSDIIGKHRPSWAVQLVESMCSNKAESGPKWCQSWIVVEI